jgi:hypothetical protein
MLVALFMGGEDTLARRADVLAANLASAVALGGSASATDRRGPRV